MSSKPRNSKKSKTSALYEIRHDEPDKNVEMARSINIVALKTAHRMSSTSAQKRRLTETQPVIRPSKRTQKLSLNVASGTVFNFDNEFRKELGVSVYSSPSHKNLEVLESIEKMQKANLINVENNRVHTDMDSFQKICGEFLTRIDELERENCHCFSSIKKYQLYFKELKIKEEALNQEEESQEERKQNRPDRGTQLKILNLERKIETLNYIIKNYRSNNKEEIKVFEKKINEFRPSLESQLTHLLSEANKKNNELEGLVSYFQKECAVHIKGANWVNIVLDLKNKDAQIQQLRDAFSKASESLLEAKAKLQDLYPCQIENKQLRILASNLSQEKSEMANRLSALEKEKNFKELEMSELVRELQELSFKLKALEGVEERMREKEESLKKNTLLIARLQNQISSLRSKIVVMTKATQSQLFNKETGSVQNIENCMTDIEELTSRFGEEVDNIVGGNAELSSFIYHLFDRTKQSFEKIVDEYREHLRSSQLENKQLKNRLDAMISSVKRRAQESETILMEIEVINEKRNKSLAGQSKMENLNDCTVCKSWLLHSGQINNWCEKMQGLLKKYLEIE